MLFNSLKYIIFLPCITFLYLIIPYRFRWMLLLGSSYYFYMSWNPEYIFLILAATVINYFVGIKISETENLNRKKAYLLLSIFTSIGILFLYKYFNFLNNSIKVAIEHFNMEWGIPNFSALLPVGISFYTFKSLSYSIDVYKGSIKPEKHFGIFALFVSFFPELLAGPIDRSSNLIKQFHQKHSFDYNKMTGGLKLMMWGYFKKFVIADRLAFAVNGVYDNVYAYSGFPLIIATFLFAFQIYCDFSGYSDIAIGSAQIMGIDLMENFNRPYFSKSIQEFWRRWHISLSTWFRDYVYIPLGGSRVTKPRFYFNLFTTFLVSGLWHGANWTFIVWGALHGIYQIFGKLTNNTRAKLSTVLHLNDQSKLKSVMQIFITFILVDFAWIFFRANSLADSVYIVRNLFKGLSHQMSSLATINNSLGDISRMNLLIAFASLVLMEVIHFIHGDGSTRQLLQGKPVWVRWSLYYCLTVWTLFFGKFESSQFIYFQF